MTVLGKWCGGFARLRRTRRSRKEEEEEDVTAGMATQAPVVLYPMEEKMARTLSSP
jgi:hypothetical protein